VIEVEVMINNQTIVILIDSGASHSYIHGRKFAIAKKQAWKILVGTVGYRNPKRG
jgi:hypothetical protein